VARRRFENRDWTDADRRDVLSKVRSAFEDGRLDVMMVSFPSDLCTDGCRINNRFSGWQETLPGGARWFRDF